MTYCWDNVDIPITIERDGIDKQKRERSEIVLAKPLCAGQGKFVWDTVLFLH